MRIKPLEEFKPRKAAFGFRIEDFTLEHIIPVGELLKYLIECPRGSYTLEYGMPYKGRSIGFKVYTDDPALAATIRDTFAPVVAIAVSKPFVM